MTVSELIAILQRMKGDSEVRIPVEFTHSTMGASPAISVSRVYSGFDWDNGVVFISHGKHAIVFDDEQYNAFKDEKRKVESKRSMLYMKNHDITDVYKQEHKVNPLFRRYKDVQ